jgi:hypothetical protein
MQSIYIYPGEKPVCPNCGKSSWLVIQKLERCSNLIRIDGLGDIIVSPFNPNEYNEAISISCDWCTNTFQPQPGVACTKDGRQDAVECYDETKDDYLGFPERFTNRDEY